MKRKVPVMIIGLSAMLGMSSCGSWWATSSVGPDLYLDDTYGPSYYYGYGPGYTLTTPPPPPPKPAPGGSHPGNHNPGQQPPNGSHKPNGNTPPPANNSSGSGQRPSSSNSHGGQSQGGFRGQQGSGAATRH